MFRIKICGITNLADALAAVEAGADAVGLNFYAGSPRHVSLDEAAAIAAALPNSIVKVGVFVNASAEEVRRHYEAAELDLLQLHGDEPPKFLAELAGLPVMRALRPTGGDTAGIREYVARCRELSVPPRLLLLDAPGGGAYGGTGERADWTAAADLCRDVGMPPVVLAGGLRPDNVAAAILAVRPAAVDVASGVESSPGRKDRTRMVDFVAAAKEAFRAIGLA